MKNYLKHFASLIAIIVFVIFAVASSEESSNDKETVETNTTDTTQKSSELKKEEVSNWKYEENEDKMTGKKRFFASTVSTNEIEFEFPYNGGSTFQLIVRNMNKKNEILLSVSKGQFMTSIMESEYLRVKFDEEQPSKYTFNSPSDGSDNLIFVSSPKKFINKLKKAEKLMIEAPFFNAGRQIIYFDVKGLEWEK